MTTPDSLRRHPGYAAYPSGFFDRVDASPDPNFYSQPRLVTHIDDGAISAVGQLYQRLGIDGRVLDIMSSWISHFVAQPEHLTVLGMNRAELEANPMASAHVVHDLNVEPAMPFPDLSFDAVTCCVSVDYLIAPLEVFAEVARILRPGGLLVCTFSNRCFPTKAIRGWLTSDDAGHCDIVRSYYTADEGMFEALTVEALVEAGPGADPLFAVSGTRSEKPADPM